MVSTGLPWQPNGRWQFFIETKKKERFFAIGIFWQLERFYFFKRKKGESGRVGKRFRFETMKRNEKPNKKEKEKENEKQKKKQNGAGDGERRPAETR